MVVLHQNLFYDTDKYKLKEKLSEILKVEDLTELSKLKLYDTLTRDKDQSTIRHKAFYENWHRLEPMYKELLQEIKEKYFDGEQIVYQRVPTFRTHLDNNIAVGEWHKDRTYNHHTNEINFRLPFTDAFGNNTIRIESEEDKADYHPQRVNYGEIFVFDGANLMHGNKTNDTGKDRISCDFRIIPYKDYKPSDKETINTGMKFDIGGYFELL